MCLLAATQPLSAVTAVPAGALVRYKANYFNLAQKRLRFTPRGTDAYDLTVGPNRNSIEGGSAAGKPTDARGYSWRMPLAFQFAYGGKIWDEVYVNLNGSLSFGVPEAVTYPERETWPDGTMRSMASIFDVRAISGERPMIVPLWGLNSADSTHIYTHSSRKDFVVTWRAVRYQAAHEGYDPLGESVFQVRLGRDGSIEFRYGTVAEKDGIVGLFCGRNSAGKVLDRLDVPPHPNLRPEVDIRRVEVEERGIDVRFSLTLAGPLPPKLAEGNLLYGIATMTKGEGNVMRLTVDSSGAKSDPFCVVINPRDQVTGTDCVASMIAIPGNRSIEFYLPKIALKDPSRFEWKAEISGTGSATPLAGTGEMRPVALSSTPFGFDLSRNGHFTVGNVYEIFAYPFLAKSRSVTFQEIYKQCSADDDLAIALTDFRIDDIYDHGASNGAGNEEGEPLKLFNSPKLQQAAGPVFIGPRFREVIEAGGRTFRHYAFATAWGAHEMTHRWVAALRWKAENPTALLDMVQQWHWNPLLYTPVVTPVASYFADSPYPEPSIMGGMTIENLPDGSAHSVFAQPGAPSGLCALDLYSMGLIGPNEVPDTWFIAGSVPDGKGGLKGGDAETVTIADIIAANGPRKPPAKDAQHQFKFEIYLLHEDGRPPDPAKLAQARGIEASIVQYFTIATNGRMTVTPTR
ncbi:MAG TPA: hypothetical protein VKU01_30300 [Bryobacteraceae bacterium]|nr:hypothetical protein [Bryobacteraceae bacterium]